MGALEIPDESSTAVLEPLRSGGARNAANFVGRIFMESRAKFLGHPLHQQLIVFPLGLLATAVIFDLISFATDNMRWTDIAFYMIGAGVITGLLAAVFGAIDWWAIPSGTRAKRVGAVHGIGNVIVVLLFSASFLLRWVDPMNAPTLAYGASFAGFALALVTGWLGGELVDRLGVGVDAGAHLDAPSSLTSRSATDHSRKRRPAA
jgi:uncharacterized membrane protein